MLKTLLLWFATAFYLTSVYASEVSSTYQYGRFKVEVLSEGGQRVIGGEFIPPAKPPLPSNSAHVIFINHTTKELSYYKRTEAGFVPVIGYAVVTPSRESLPRDVIRGKVRQVVEKPIWCPKVGGLIRKEDPTLPAGCLPYGHPQNAMGDWRFDISWDVSGYELVRLHGTTGYPAGSFWDQETYGCIRLQNRAIKNLIDLLGPEAIRQGVEVVLWRSVPTLSGE